MKYFLLALSLFVSGNIYTNSDNTEYVLYYQASQGAMWSKGGTYMSFNACMNAAQYQYNWAYNTRCNAEN